MRDRDERILPPPTPPWPSLPMTPPKGASKQTTHPTRYLLLHTKTGPSEAAADPKQFNKSTV
jgi:hypothetical protein